MPEHGALPFAAWEGFYVIVGTSAAALTGLQFVGIHNAWKRGDLYHHRAATLITHR